MEMIELLELSVKRGASDLHLLPGVQPLLRVHGALIGLKEVSLFTPEEIKRLIYSCLTLDQQKKLEINLVCEVALTLPKIGSFRVSVFHQLHGIGAVFRVIPPRVPTLDGLDVPPVFKTLLMLTQGLILVTGATGSGKSTTLAAMIDHINTNRVCNIITIEDPIEFVHQNKKSIFNQIQVGRDTPDFSAALRASLRQDPNVILLGELRDLDTMRLALTAAETGHLVLATLHAVSAPLAINRFADVFPTEEKNRVRNLLAETLQAVICQTLVKKNGGGRMAAFEILLATTPVRHFIRQDMTAHMESAMQTNCDKGMCTLEQYLQQLVNDRLITSAIASGVVANRGSFKDVGERKA
jgi:twitching motility protein PilT